jgi:hypothetical protein
VGESLDGGDGEIDLHGSAEPADAFVVLPLAMALLALLDVNVDGDAVAHGVLELAKVEVAVFLDLLALALLHAVHELSEVQCPVRPLHASNPLNLTVLELSRVGLLLVLENILSLSLEQSVLEVSFVVRPIRPLELAPSLLLTHHKVSFIEGGALVEAFFAFAVLFVLIPLALVSAALNVLEFTVSLTLAVLEFSDIVLTVWVDLAAKPFNSSFCELAFILCARHEE